MITCGRMSAVSPYHEVEFHGYLCWPVHLLLLVRIVPGGNSSTGDVLSFEPGSFRVKIGTFEFMIVVKIHVGHFIQCVEQAFIETRAIN